MTRKHLTIPECRGVLEEVARYLHINGQTLLARRVRYVISQMKRRKPVRVTPPRSRKLTPAMKRRVRLMAATTTLSQQQIAVRLKLNSGRVSEALAGKRR